MKGVLRLSTRLFGLGLFLAAFSGGSSAQAQEWQDYLYWPYYPPQYGSQYHQENYYEGHYIYPREMRVYPQIPGPGYINFYGGQKIYHHRTPSLLETGHNYRFAGKDYPGPINYFHSYGGQRFYYGNHFRLDVF